MYDAIIVGGSNAGLSAALALGRSRRRVLVIDSGRPRNQPAQAMHNFLSRDGTSPAELRRIGSEQLAAYDGVELRAGEATGAAPIAEGFGLALADGSTAAARKLLLASGVEDLLPPIPGLAELWGGAVFHCPYCHGWEMRDLPLAVCASGPLALEALKLLRGWTSDLALCSNGPAELSAEEREQIVRRGIPIYEAPIARLAGADGELARIEFADGGALERRGLMLRVPQRQRSDLAGLLGCELVGDGPLAHLIKVDMLGRTSVPGLYAAGDCATPLQQAIAAAAAGAAAGAGINHELLAEEWAALG
ncbi:MAG TPA: NAD(P)/FAD-dependent oxidoreductase [Herpetosiphonaceae bacterium]